MINLNICYLTTVSITLKSFVIPQIEYLKKEHPEWKFTVICDNDEEFNASLPDYITYIPLPMTRGVNLKDSFNLFRLAKIFKRYKYDMVVYSTPNAALMASLAGYISKVPIRLYNQWGIRYVTFGGFKRFIFKSLEKITCIFSTHIKAVSFKNRQFAIDEHLCKEEKISVIGIGGTIGVDLLQYDIANKDSYREQLREKYGIKSNDFVFGYVGRLNVDKGINELVEAFSDINNAKLMLVGSIDENYGPSNENSSIINSNTNILLVGAVEASEVCKYLSAFDVLVHPTYREGFGKVLQEAMAMGVPVITTDVPGPSEVIEDGISGVLVQAKNSQALKTAMLDLMNDDKHREQYALRGRERVEKYFERSIMLNNILKDYHKVLKIEKS